MTLNGILDSYCKSEPLFHVPIQYQIFNISMLDFDLPDSKEVDLKDFLKGIRESPHFKESVGK